MKKISATDLRQKWNEEGLIIQGCGGDLKEWEDGINGILTEEGILLDGTKFSNVSTFENEGITNIIFEFTDDVHLNVGKLAIWRLQTHSQFGGIWLSDYVVNRLGGFRERLPSRKTKQKILMKA